MENSKPLFTYRTLADAYIFPLFQKMIVFLVNRIKLIAKET